MATAIAEGDHGLRSGRSETFMRHNRPERGSCQNVDERMKVIDAIGANDAWHKAFELLHQPNVSCSVSGRGGSTQEVLHVLCRLTSSSQHWTVSRTPPMNPAFAIAEVVWILNGRDDSEFLNQWNSKLPSYAGSGPTYDGAYGSRLRKSFGVDQVRRVCDALSSDAQSRQAVLQIWDARRDLPSSDGSPVSPDVPCNISSLLKVRNGALQWTQVMRSNDLLLGLPYNLVQFTFLHEIIAGCLGVATGDFCHFADSLHAYYHDLRRFSARPNVSPAANTDRLDATIQDSDRHFRRMATAIEMLGRASVAECERIASGCQVPKPYRNLLLVVAAEAARRQGNLESAGECIAACDNPSLREIYTLWAASKITGKQA